jgi:type IV secretory pathway TrbL component
MWHSPEHGDGWAVKGAGNSKATKVTSTQSEAIQVAQVIARNQHSDTKIHGANGQIRAGNSYGNDQCPPMDKK